MHPTFLITNASRIIRSTTSLLFTSLLLASSCTNTETSSQSPTSTPEISSASSAYTVDSTHDSAFEVSAPTPHGSNKPDTLSFVTQPSFEADHAILRQDTLLVVASSLDVIYPFGQVAHAADIRRKYPQFVLKRGTEQYNGIITSYTILNHKSSSVKFHDSELDGATVVAGRILDSDLALQNTVHVGMSLTQVLHIFFADIDQTKLQHLQVLRIDSGVAEIKYFYNFEHDKLKYIKLDSYSALSKNL